jgi:type IV secretory pathway VirB4 component
MESRVRRWITSSDVAALRSVIHDGGTGLSGEPLGVCEQGPQFVFDPFGAYRAGLVTNPNLLVTGAIGTGKSTVVKMLLMRALAEGRSAVVMDPKGEYGDLAHELGGSVVELGADSPTWCNPFTGELRDDLALTEALIATSRAAALSDEERYWLEATWRQAVHEDETRPLAALARELVEHLSDADASARRSLAFALRRFVDGDLGGLFDGDARAVVPEGELVILDISRAWSSDHFAVTSLAAMAVARQFLELKAGAGYLVVDEAWAMLSEPRVAHWLQGSWKLARARATSHVLVLHRWSDAFSMADEGSAQRAKVTSILRDCDTTFLFRQDPGELALLDEVLQLNRKERQHVVELTRGVALVRYGAARSLVRFDPSTRDRRVIDTDQAMRDGQP